MRIAFFSSILLAFCACSVAPAQVSDATSVGSSTNVTGENSKTRLEIRTAEGRNYNVWVRRDASISPKANPSAIEIVTEVKDTAIVIIDTYPSIAGGLSYCQAGKERFLRVISLLKQLPEETFEVKLESCRDNIELASPGVEWISESSTLRIHWLLGPTARGTPEIRTIHIDAEGRARTISSGS